MSTVNSLHFKIKKIHWHPRPSRFQTQNWNKLLREVSRLSKRAGFGALSTSSLGELTKNSLEVLFFLARQFQQFKRVFSRRDKYPPFLSKSFPFLWTNIIYPCQKIILKENSCILVLSLVFLFIKEISLLQNTNTICTKVRKKLSLPVDWKNRV